MIVVDIEASGTEYAIHSIVSIGALDLERPDVRFYQECRVWDGAHIMEDALAVIGMTAQDITDPGRATESETVRAFLEWSQHFSDRTLAGQNVCFDRDFLKAAAQRAGIAWDMPSRTIDTHTLCYMHMIKRGVPVPTDPQHRHSDLSLDEILAYCGVPAEQKPHNALTGALCHAEVIARLLYDKTLLPEYASHPIPWH